MRFLPVFAALLFGGPLWAAAGGATTAIDGAGNVWLTGTAGFMLTTATAFQKTAVSSVCGTQDLSPFVPPTVINCEHAYLSRQDASGKVLYATYLGGSSQDSATAITTDAQGNVYIAGYTYSADFPVTPGVFQFKNAGPVTPSVYTSLGAPFGASYVVPGGDAFVAKFGSDGTLLFSTLLGGSDSDIPTLIAADPDGSVYVSGVTRSKDFPTTAGAMSPTAAGSFFARLNATGTALTYSTYSPSSILAFDVDNHGRAYLTGVQESGPYITVLDTTASQVVSSTYLPDIAPDIAGAGVAITVNGAQNLFLGVSPAPPTLEFFTPTPPARTLGTSYLLELPPGAGRIIAQTGIASSQFDSLLTDAAGNVYAFGHGTGAVPATPLQLLAAPCSKFARGFVLESDSAGALVAATYLRQGDNAGAALTAPGHILLYRSRFSATVPLDLTVQPAAFFGCLENLASNIAGLGLAPGEIFVITGSGLGPAQGIGAVPNSDGMYPTSLGGVQVLFNSVPVPLLYVQANEIHAVAPFSLAGASAVQVRFGTESVSPLDVSSAIVNPGIFSVNGQGAIINQDGTVNTPANPARLGSIVSVYCTGTGYLETPVTDGQVAPIPPPYNVTELAYPRLTFAGVDGTTLWSGAAPGLIEGVTQINVRLPLALPAGTSPGAVPVILNAGVALSPPVLISVRQ